MTGIPMSQRNPMMMYIYTTSSSLLLSPPILEELGTIEVTTREKESIIVIMMAINIKSCGYEIILFELC